MRKCAVCEKTSVMAGTRKLLRGHYNPTNWTRKYPNLQKTKDQDGKRILACIKCLRRLSGKTEPKSRRSRAKSGSRSRSASGKTVSAKK